MKCILEFVVGFVVIVLLWKDVFGIESVPSPSFLLNKPDNVLFEEFQNKFNAKFANTAEKSQRFNIFAQNLVKIRALNAQNNGAKFGINAFSAMSPEEFKQRLISDEYTPPHDMRMATNEDIYGHENQHDVHHRIRRDVVYPDSFDWRSKNVVTPIKDQGSCGSCWAFADVAGVESHYAIFHNTTNLRELSEQEMVDCSGAGTCNGGFTMSALYYIKEKGLVSRASYPYTGWDGACQQNMTGERTKIADFFYLNYNETDIKNFVFNKGPAIFSFVCPSSFQYYSSGIFSLTNEQCNNERVGGHAMIIVGYGEENGKKYWIVKNSWGTWWGENGFARIERDINFCGMAYNSFAPSFVPPPTTTTSTTTTTTTPPPTTLKPVPYTPLNCSGAMDLVIVIDNTILPARVETIKSQLMLAIDENGINWDKNDNSTARVGIVLSTGWYSGSPTTTFRYLDFKGCRQYSPHCQGKISTVDDLKQAIYEIPYGGSSNNNVSLNMILPLTGDFNGFPNSYYPFGEKIFGGEYDRPNVPNAMIVISGVYSIGDVSYASNEVKEASVQVFGIGVQELPISKLQAITGNPTTAFSTNPENVANIIKTICTPTTPTPSTVPTGTTTTPATPTSVSSTTAIITTTATTVAPAPFTPLNCSGAMDLLIIFDNTMTPARIETVKSQLMTAIDENGIKWDKNDNNTARVGIVLTTGWYNNRATLAFRHLDFKGCRQRGPPCIGKISTVNDLKQAISDIPYGVPGSNNIDFALLLSVSGDYYGEPEAYYPFGERIISGSSDRLDVPNAVIVITGADTSDVASISQNYNEGGVPIFSIGFEDISLAQLQAISGNPATAFSTNPENVASIIKTICTSTTPTPSTVPTTTTTPPMPTSVSSTTAITTTTTTVSPAPFTPLNCSGAMDLLIIFDNTMTPARIEIVKSQLMTAIDENGIKWDKNDNNTARVGIVLTTGWYNNRATLAFRHLDFKGCRQRGPPCIGKISTVNDLKQAIYDIPYGSPGSNNIDFALLLSVSGDYYGEPEAYYPFGERIISGSSDRLDVPNAVIVITGADTSDVASISQNYNEGGVPIFSIGFDDISLAQLQAISGNPATAFSTYPENVGNTIKTICTGI